MENPGYYAVIPASVRYDKTITPNAKLLFGEISALCNKEGYSWATNAYFAELYDVKTETISAWISSLYKAGHIEIEQEPGKLRMITLPKNRKGGSEKSEGTLPKNRKQNNTYNNTSNINTGEATASREKTPKFSSMGAEVIKGFEAINPAAKRYYANTTQRQAADELIKVHGYDLVSRVVSEILPKTNGREFMPTITTPLQLLEKWASLEAAIRREKSKRNTNVREFTPNI